MCEDKSLMAALQACLNKNISWDATPVAMYSCVTLAVKSMNNLPKSYNLKSTGVAALSHRLSSPERHETVSQQGRTKKAEADQPSCRTWCQDPTKYGRAEAKSLEAAIAVKLGNAMGGGSRKYPRCQSRTASVRQRAKQNRPCCDQADQRCGEKANGPSLAIELPASSDHMGC